MAIVLNRVTKQLRKSVNTPDFPVADWIINPNLINVENTPTRYWNITDDLVTLMSQVDRDFVDTTLAADSLQTQIDEAISSTDTNRRLLGFMAVMVQEVNFLRAELNLTPVRTLANYKTQTKLKIGEQS